jgi:enediyne core biosynthesis thioesterase
MMQQEATQNWFEHRLLVTFGDTNVVGNVYFANYFHWQGACREAMLAEYYPEFEDDLHRGFSFITEFAHMDFLQEAHLFDRVLVRMTSNDLSRTRFELEFEFLREKEGFLLARGKQAVVWVNPQHRPSLMPDKLYDSFTTYFGVSGP